MSTSAPEPIIVPDTPQDIYIPGPLRSTFAKEILRLSGDSGRAERADYCGRFCDRRDKNGHRKRRVQRCNCAFCFGCAPRKARGTFERWEKMLDLTVRTADFLEDGPSPHCATYIEARILHSKRDRNACEELLSGMEDQLCDELLIKRNAGLGTHFTTLPGYIENNAILRLLIVNAELKSEEWAAMFPPSATVKVINSPLCELPHLFKQMLQADFLKDLKPADRAEQEVLFAGMRRFRAHGISLGGEEKNDLFTSTENTSSTDALAATDEVLVNNSSDASIVPSAHNHDICEICGEPFIEQSQWFGADAPEPRPEEYRWHPSS